MLKRLAILSHLSLILLLSGCATYFERAAQNECFNKDWYAAGFDGAKYGQDPHEIWQKEDRKCEKYNIWSNKEGFQRGYELGLDAFCTEQNGFEFGLRDRNYKPLCAPEEQLDFDIAYRDGQQIYQTQHRLSNAEYEIHRARSTIKHATKRREYLACEIESGKLDDKTKKRYVSERYDLKRERESARYDLHQYRDRARELEAKLSYIESSFEQQYYPHGQPEETPYSVEHSVVSENQIVSGPTILLYKPKSYKKGVFNKEQKQDLKEQVKTIVSHVALNHKRRFRFQVINNVDLSFLKPNGKEITLNAAQKFDSTPSLIFWQEEQGLLFHKLKAGMTPPLTALDTFISAHGQTAGIQSTSGQVP